MSITFQPGDGATRCMWSDRHAGTIVSVSASGKSVEWRADDAVRTDNNGMSESQTYAYTPGPESRPTVTYTLRKNGRWVRQGDSMHGEAIVPGRHSYYDYTF